MDRRPVNSEGGCGSMTACAEELRIGENEGEGEQGKFGMRRGEGFRSEDQFWGLFSRTDSTALRIVWIAVPTAILYC